MENVRGMTLRAILNDSFGDAEATENAFCACPLEIWIVFYDRLQAIAAFETSWGILIDVCCPELQETSNGLVLVVAFVTFA